jgi:hypothetical protein
VTGFIRFCPESTGTCQNRQPDTVTGFLRRIPGIFRRVPAGNSEFPEGFRRKFTEYCVRNHRPGFTTFSNLQYLNFCVSSIWNNRLSLADPYPGINSSTLLELHIRLFSFSNCLYILDGRFNKLHTLHVDVMYISPSHSRNHNQVDYFG